VVVTIPRNEEILRADPTGVSHVLAKR